MNIILCNSDIYFIILYMVVWLSSSINSYTKK